MTIPRAVAEDLWVVDHALTLPGGIDLGTRSTLIRLGDGRLLVHSPGPLSPALKVWLGANGPVAAIVAPSLLHHFSVQENAEAFPEAECFGPPGFTEKIGIDAEVLDGSGTPWETDLDSLLVGGCPRMNELAFLHRKSGTLILTDLAFNFRSAEGFRTRLFLRINGVLDQFGSSRLARHYFFGDLAQVRSAVERVLEWDFERIVVAHGDVLEGDGPARLRSGFAWLLD